ncbi:hypothetical protein TIFTF001_050602, partial [Ficus carica]|jgi:hypothetical protein
MTSRV